MNRNTVIVDGTKSGPACSRAKSDQSFGPRGKGGAQGLNGIMVWKADQRLGPESDRLQLPQRQGRRRQRDLVERRRRQRQDRRPRLLRLVPDRHEHVLQAERHRRRITGSSRATGAGAAGSRPTPATSADSGYYIGACQQRCDLTINRAHAEYNALGYSGTNSGGALVIKNSEFDHNQDGFDTNSENGDPPPPQNGAARNGDQPDHPHPLVLGVPGQQRPRQQQPQRPRGGPGRLHASRGRVCHSAGPATTP